MAYLSLLIYTALLFIRPQEWLSWMRGAPILDFFVAVILLTGIASLQNSGWKMRRAPQNGLVIALLVAVLASHGLRFDPYVSAVWTTLIGPFGKMILLYFFISSLLSSTRHVRTFLTIVAIGVVFMSLHAILQIHRGYGFGGSIIGLPKQTLEGVRAQAFGFFNDPNDLALVFVASLPFFLRALLARTSLPPKRALALALIGLITYATYLTKSRGGWLALGVTLASYFALNSGGKHSRKIAIVFGVVILVGVIVIAPGRMGRYDPGDASARGRWSLWGEGIGMLKKSPLVGVGIGRFDDESEAGLVAHNSFVQSFAETGLLGYFFFVALLLASLHDGYKMMNIDPGEDPEVTALVELNRAAVPALIGYMAAAFFLSRAFVEPLYILLGLFAAMRGIHSSLELPTEGLFSIKKYWRRVLILEFASIIFIWMFTRVMWMRGG